MEIEHHHFEMWKLNNETWDFENWDSDFLKRIFLYWISASSLMLQWLLNHWVYLIVVVFQMVQLLTLNLNPGGWEFCDQQHEEGKDSWRGAMRSFGRVDWYRLLPLSRSHRFYFLARSLTGNADPSNAFHQPLTHPLTYPLGSWPRGDHTDPFQSILNLFVPLQR